MKKTIYFWTILPNPYNSLHLQIRLLCNILPKYFDIKPAILHPRIKNIRHILRNIKKDDVIFWHYGSFDRYIYDLPYISQPVFVYHATTPARYFWKTEPPVAVKSLVGQIQMMLFKKNIKWITANEYNKNTLQKMGFEDISVCPYIVSSTGGFNTGKTQKPSLIFVGRIVQNKNCLQLLRQVKKTADQYVEPIELVIVGTPKAKTPYALLFIHELEKLEKSKKVEIKWIKDVDNDRLRKLYQRSWLYISLSYHEGFGLPACESISNHTPAIYLQCGGQESVLNSIGMIPLKEEKTFYKYIVDLLNHKEEREKLLDKQRVIVNSFMSPLIDETIVECYKSFLS